MAIVHSFEERFERSVSTFTTKVWPLVRDKFGPGDVIRVEDLQGGPLARMVDVFCGIDYLFHPSGGRPFGIAQRVTNGTWDSFTQSVGAYRMFLAAWERPLGQIIPAVTIQAWTVGETVQRVGMVVTADLLGYAVRHPRPPLHGPSGPFHAWTFAELVEDGVPVDLFPAPGLRDPFR